MADILERIQNPLSRAATAAVMGASVATILTGGVLGLSRLDASLVNRLSVYLGIGGAGVGAVYGCTVTPASKPHTRLEPDASETSKKSEN